jgi:hypothetical protein
MIDRRGVFKSLVSNAMFAAILALIPGQSPAARGQEVPVPDPAVQQGAWTEEQFDALVDQIVSEINDRDSADRGRLNDQLALKLDWVEATCKTSEAQRKKLQIAGRGDIKRFLDEMREMKRRYRQVKGNLVEFGKMRQQLAAIQSSSGAEIFGESSLLSKMLRMTLSAEQLVAIKRGEAEARAFASRAAVEQAVQFCDVAVGLKDEQRRKLTELLVHETREMKPEEPAGLPAQFSMVLVTAKSSHAKFKAIFDERQWRAMSELLKQLEQGARAGGFARLRGNIEFDLIGVDFVGVDEFIVPEPPAVPADANEE